MTTFDPAFDYIELLGLTPEAVLAAGADDLRSRISARKKELTRSEQNPLYSQQSRSAKERLLQFEKLLDCPEALTAYVYHQQEARAVAKNEQEAAIRRLLGVALMTQPAPTASPPPMQPPVPTKGASWKWPPGEGSPTPPPMAVSLSSAPLAFLTTRQHELLLEEARTQGIPDGVVASVLGAMKIRLKKKPGGVATRPELPLAADAMESAVFLDIHNWLAVLEKPNLFAFLGLDKDVPPAQLVSSARLVYHKWSRMLPKTSVSTAWEKCAQACMTYLKSVEGKKRYLGALANFRIDQFVRRVDLVLAGETFGPGQHEILVRIGAQEYGLSAPSAQQTIAARAFALGVSLTPPVTVTVTLDGNVQCRQCFAWTQPFEQNQCTICGASLTQKCANPDCGQLVPPGAKACPACEIPVARGKQYARLLELTDVLLDVGHANTALDACGLAEQICRGPATAVRVARATKIRSLLAAVRDSIATRCWNKAHHELQQLTNFSPRFNDAEIPRLEAIIKYKARQRKRISDAPASAEVGALVALYVSVLDKWADSQEAIQRSRLLARVLIDQKQLPLARTLVSKLQEIQPRDLETISLGALLNRVTHQLEDQRDQPVCPPSQLRDTTTGSGSETNAIEIADVQKEEMVNP